MRLTTKGRYAVTAMLDLAVHHQKGPVALSDISDRQEISLSYLEQLFSQLRKNGLVKSTRGPGGGYRLNLEAEKIFIADVIAAVDEKLDTTRCRGSKNCQNNMRCLTHDLWEELGEQIHIFLSGISLHQLVSRQATRDVVVRQDSLMRNHQRAGAGSCASAGGHALAESLVSDLAES